MPRPEQKPDDSWPIMIKNSFKDDFNFISYLRRGATIDMLEEWFSSVIHLYRPPIVFFQVGIVDCVRRALPEFMIKLITNIPYLNKYIRLFIKKHHYFITKISNTRRTRLSIFKKKIESIIAIAEKHETKVIFISICPPGDYLINSTYNVNHDINMYNSLMDRICHLHLNAKVLFPYSNISFINRSRIVLNSDGHHLTEFGHNLVSKKVIEELYMLLERRDI